MRGIFLEKDEIFYCPHCSRKVVFDVKKTLYFSDSIAMLGGKCRLNTYTEGIKTKIEDAKSRCAHCSGNVYENLITKINYLLPDELFEI